MTRVTMQRFAELMGEVFDDVEGGTTRFEMMAGAGMVVTVFIDEAEVAREHQSVEARAVALTQLAVAQMLRRRRSETCDHQFDSILGICPCGARKGEYD